MLNHQQQIEKIINNNVVQQKTHKISSSAKLYLVLLPNFTQY
jgi:hypothetical protein